MSTSQEGGDTRLDTIADSQDGDGGGGDGGDGGGGFGLSQRAILSALGIGTGVWATIVAFGEDPVGYIRGVVETIIFQDVLRPTLLALWDSGLATLDSILIIGFGDDYALGISEGSTIGLIDVPFVIVAPIVDVIGIFGESILGLIGTANGILAGFISANLGLAAAPVVTTAWAVEIGLATWGAWILLQTADVFTGGTIDSVIDIGQAVFAPAINAWRWLTG